MLAALVFVLSPPGTAYAVDNCEGAAPGLGGHLNIIAGQCVVNALVVRSGTFTLAEDLHIVGAGNISIPLGGSLTINITGSLIMDANTEILGDVNCCQASPITITATNDINLATGALIRSYAFANNVAGKGGAITLHADFDHDGSGTFTSAPGSKVDSFGAHDGGAITITGATINIDGEVLSYGFATGQGHGGPITIDAACTFNESKEGVIKSLGTDPGADLVHIEGGCSVTILGLVASTAGGHILSPNKCQPPFRPGKPEASAACVEIWSGGPLTIDSTPPNNGEVHADLSGQAPPLFGWIELLAVGDITVKGDSAGAFAVHANENNFTNAHGGLIRVTSTTGSVIASGLDFQTNALANGSGGGRPAVVPGCSTAPCGGITIEGFLDVDLTNGKSESRGSTVGASAFGPHGGEIDVQAFTGQIKAANATTNLNVSGGAGAGDGIVHLTGCTAPNQFPPGTVTPPGALTVNVTGNCASSPVLPAYVAAYVNGIPQNPIVTPGLPACPGICGGGCPCPISFSKIVGPPELVRINGVDLGSSTVHQVFLNPANCNPAGVLFSQPFASQNATTIQLNVSATPANTYNIVVVGPSGSCCLATTVVLP